MPYIRKLFPPLVTGTVVMMIGLSLIPVAFDWFAGGQRGDANYATPQKNLMMASFVLVIVVALVQWGKGIFRSRHRYWDVMTGYLVCLGMGWVSFEGVKQAQTSRFQNHSFGSAFPISGIIGMSIAYLVTIVESSGNFLALGNATKTEITGRHLRGGVLADGLGSALAAIMSTTPFFILTKHWCHFSNWRGKSSRGCANRCTSSASELIPCIRRINCFNSITVLGGAGLMMFAMIIAAYSNVR